MRTHLHYYYYFNSQVKFNKLGKDSASLESFLSMLKTKYYVVHADISFDPYCSFVT